MKDVLKLPLTGVLVGGIALALAFLGNPANMAFCIACFLRDTAGALGLHRAKTVQYLRPEIIGIVLGAFAASAHQKDLKAQGGSAPFSRFLLGASTMVGALMFLGCPLRMLLRLAGGDLNALVGLAGFVAGIGLGVVFLNGGFSLKRAYPLPRSEGYLFPGLQLLLLMLLLGAPALLFFSESGPGSQRAPLGAALAAGLFIGAVGQRVRLCFVGGIRDAMLFRQFSMVLCFGALVATVATGNLAAGSFHLGFADQPIAHTDGLWNFLGLFLVGLASVLLGGCPYRQLVLAGSGNTDSAIAVVGLVAGAAFAHNLGLASSPAGPTLGGKVALGLCLAATLAIALTNLHKVQDSQ